MQQKPRNLAELLCIKPSDCRYYFDQSMSVTDASKLNLGLQLLYARESCGVYVPEKHFSDVIELFYAQLVTKKTDELYFKSQPGKLILFKNVYKVFDFDAIKTRCLFAAVLSRNLGGYQDVFDKKYVDIAAELEGKFSGKHMAPRKLKLLSIAIQDD